jgi:hypothetical protein
MKLGKTKAGGDDVLEGISQMYQPAGTATQQDRETVKQPHGGAASEEEAPAEGLVVKTSFYPKPDQLDKLDDLASEYNRRYRRKRPRINRNDIVRFLIDLVDLDMLDELNLKS